MVKDVKSSNEFYAEIKKKNLTVAKFSASWCGPCVKIAPFVDQLVRKYPNVNFIGIDVDSNPVAQEVGVRSMPTFHFYIDGRKVDELIGANEGALENKVIQHKVEVAEAFAGKGFTMAGTGASPADAASMREARLKAFNATQLPPPPKVESNLADMIVASADEDDAALAKAIAESLVQSSGSSTAQPQSTDATKPSDADDGMDLEDGDEEMVSVPVDETILKEMIDMGFPDVRARKSIVHGKTLEGALQWISEHEDDPEIDQPYLVKKSSLEPKRELTEEEKAQKMLAIKEKIRLKKEEKEREEKEREIQREKERRERGKSTTEIQDERDRLMRKRDAEKLKKEKMDADKERSRILAEIARDKELRKLNKGVLPSVLGADGYNPSGVQYDVDGNKDASTDTVNTAPVENKPVPAPVKKPATSGSLTSLSALSTAEKEQKIDAAIATLMKYRTAGDGGHALKLLLTFVKNVNDQPHEIKYRSINTESNAFKTKLAPLIGSTIILKLVGFTKSPEDESKLRLDGDIDLSLIALVTAKLTKAEATYRELNP